MLKATGAVWGASNSAFGALEHTAKPGVFRQWPNIRPGNWQLEIKGSKTANGPELVIKKGEAALRKAHSRFIVFLPGQPELSEYVFKVRLADAGWQHIRELVLIKKD
jgi:hypothetical protein